MSDAEKTVFISYRRSVSRHLARSIALDLRAHDYDVFFDVDTVDNGEFDQIVLHQIALRTHFVLVLSRGSLERCADETDSRSKSSSSSSSSIVREVLANRLTVSTACAVHQSRFIALHNTIAPKPY